MGSSRDEVAAAYDALDAALDTILGLDFDAVSPAEKVRLAARMERNLRRAPSVGHRLIAELREQCTPAELGAASWADVLTTSLRVDRTTANRRLRLCEHLGPRRAMTGQPLPPRWAASAAAQQMGLIGEDHLKVIAKFHRALPGWVDEDTRAAADAQLALAGSGLDPDNLAAAAARLLTMIDQDGPQPSDAKRARKRGLHVGPQQADGMARISGWLTPEALAVFEAVQAKLAAPGMCNPDDEQPCVEGEPDEKRRRADTRTTAQRNHDAWLAVGRLALCSGQLGSHHGLPVSVVVSTTLQELQNGAGVAVTGGGSLLPMADLIRMASHAYHYLAIFDAHTNQALYLGRTKRLASPAQRIMLYARDRGCTRPGCTCPGYWCQVHHLNPWQHGGHTNVDDMTLACGPENRMIETTGWTTRRNTRGHIEWVPPTDLDTGQHRVNGYHHPERYLLPEDDEEP